MPEGDTIHRLALRFQPLVGQTLERLELPRKNVSPEAYRGRRITAVEALGKNLLIHLEGGVSLRTHLKMHGSWSLSAREGTRPVRAGNRDVVLLITEDHVAVCRSAPIAELRRTADLLRSADAQFRGGLGSLGMDVLGPTFVPEEAAARWHGARHPTIAETLLDQRLVSGIGNEWKSELLFVVRVSPFVTAASVPLPTLCELARQAQSRMRQNVDRRPRLYPIDRGRAVSRLARTERKPGEGPTSVYGRQERPCYSCRTPIERRVHGEPARVTYFCPRCQG